MSTATDVRGRHKGDSVGSMRRDSAPTGRSTWARRYGRRLLLTDLLALIWTYVAMHVVWASWNDNGTAVLHPLPLLASAVCIGVWMLALAIADTRDPRVVGSGPEEYKRIVTSTVFVFGFIALVVFAINAVVPRPYVVVALPLGLLLLSVARWTWRQWLVYRRSVGAYVDDVIVVGTARSTAHLIETIHQHWNAGYRVIGACVADAEIGGWVSGVPVVGDVTAAAHLARESHVAGVVVASSDASHPDMMRELGWDLQDSGIDLIVAPALTNIAGPRLHVRPVAGVPLLHVDPPTFRGSAYWQKAALDRLGSLTLLVVLSPVILATAVLVRISSRGPVFYVQERVGIGGRTFGMLKFRSMVPGADGMLDDLTGDTGNSMMFKMRSDPRVTKVGRMLRRFSLDELPQLFNVLTGDMSLVGPRPPLPSEVERYEHHANRRLLVRPGITGLWQVSGRADLSWEESLRLDLYYVENWSLVGDLLLLAKTARAVLASRGAY